ncbi:MAG: glycosyltransferase family 39 protein [candidate division KSB1 bacterium]|nr:glycosyltransferase family 39 protein [candidate division KSB1 bacterium]MDZ7365432.1 glycosyltransferase family 39 protein [candidate division KSB1 bacterium]MDZ7403521.1 glycosyltransferase family 39 protein [candidate division KSB1 bacterium]
MSFLHAFLFSPRWNPLGWLLPALIGAVLLYINLDKGLLQYDEADYATAARLGFRANYLDATAIPTGEFFKKGARDVLLGEHGSLAKEIRERHDINFYRHYHAPLMFYLLAIAGSLGGTSEMVFRIVALLSAVLIIPATYWSVRRVFGEQGKWIGFLSALLVAVSPMMYTTSVAISVHALYVALALMTVAAQARYFQTRRIRDFYIFAGLLALAFLANEYALFLLGACLLGFLLVPNDILSWQRGKLLVGCHFFGGMLLGALVFFLLWPAGFLKLSAVKSYLFFAYFAFVKKELAYGSQSLAQICLSRFLADPVEFIVIIFGAGFGLYGFLSKQLEKALLPLLIYPIVIFFVNLLNKAAFNTYVLSLYPLLLIFAAAGLVHWSQHQGRGGAVIRQRAVAIAMVAIAIGNIAFERFERREDVSPFRTAFQVLQSEGRHDDRVLVSFGYLPTVNYYLPEFDVYTIYLEDKPEEIAAKFEQRFYRYFIFFGKENELSAAPYGAALDMNYREVRRIPNRQNKILIIFKSL